MKSRGSEKSDGLVEELCRFAWGVFIFCTYELEGNLFTDELCSNRQPRLASVRKQESGSVLVGGKKQTAFERVGANVQCCDAMCRWEDLWLAFVAVWSCHLIGRAVGHFENNGNGTEVRGFSRWRSQRLSGAIPVVGVGEGLDEVQEERVPLRRQHQVGGRQGWPGRAPALAVQYGGGGLAATQSQWQR